MQKRSYFTSLRGKIINRALLLGVLPIVLIGAVAYQGLSQLINDADNGLNQSRAEMLDKVVGTNLSATANSIVQQLDRFLLERIGDAVTWASAPNVVAATRNAAAAHRDRGLLGLSIEEIEDQFEDAKSLGLFPITDLYLAQQIANSPHFGEVFVTDEYGYNLALTSPTSDFVQNDEGWWVTAMDNGISVGQVEFDSSADIWSIDISVRVDDPQTGKKLGVMKSVLGVSLIQEISDKRAEEIDESNVTIANSSGLLLAETATDHDVDRIMNTSSGLTISRKDTIRNALSGQGNGYIIGETEVLGYARSSGSEVYNEVANGFGGFNWLVLVEQSKSVALAPIENLNTVQANLAESRNKTLLIVGVSATVIAIIAVIMATMLSKSIIGPISELQRAAERVSKGDTSHTISIQSNDEIEDLAQVFDRMRHTVSILMDRYKKVVSARAG